MLIIYDFVIFCNTKINICSTRHRTTRKGLIMKREEMLKEFYNLLMRGNYENGLCAIDKARFDELKVELMRGVRK